MVLGKWPSHWKKNLKLVAKQKRVWDHSGVFNLVYVLVVGWVSNGYDWFLSQKGLRLWNLGVCLQRDAEAGCLCTLGYCARRQHYRTGGGGKRWAGVIAALPQPSTRGICRLLPLPRPATSILVYSQTTLICCVLCCWKCIVLMFHGASASSGSSLTSCVAWEEN